MTNELGLRPGDRQSTIDGTANRITVDEGQSRPQVRVPTGVVVKSGFIRVSSRADRPNWCDQQPHHAGKS
jgi:hypothetical protein